MRVYLVLLALMCSGCSTPYQKMGISGGYTETRLDDHIFRVSFSGNGFTGRETVSDYVLLRNAELTLKYGYKYFSIIESSNHINHSSYTTPTQSYSTGNIQSYGNYSYGAIRTTTTGGQTIHISKLSSSNVIFCFREKPEDILVFNAEYIMEGITKKYNLNSNPIPQSPSSSVIEHQIRNTIH